MANIILHSEHRIASHYLPAIINDDWTGLEDNEAAELEAWLSNNVPSGAMLNADDDSDLWHDAVTGLIADCTLVQVWINT